MGISAPMYLEINPIKQSLHISDNLRSEQINCIKTGNLNIKTDILNCLNAVNSVSTATLQAMMNLTSSLVSRIVEVEDRVRNVEVQLELENINVTNCYCNARDLNTPSSSRTHTDKEDCVNSIHNRPYTKPHKELIGEHIPVRVTIRNDDCDTQSAGDFRRVETRRVKRFCVLGLSSRVNTDVLKTVLEQKGPQERSMRVYPLRKNHRKVLLKLTLTSNDQAGLVLTNNFWPDYVKCVPWMSRDAQRKHPSTRDTSEQGSRYNNGGHWSMT
ncbi:hypothetical protein DPMN_042917 [Dreissena polymorpha]|uniref:Uncharacterized protein n=1 Tax=Dreissena polymorpha TaxID=45954 RepID=A0A9D4D1W2_DREPO|nr:hypothetical protein DPMN_042917 [Dreissena polymorpha]